MSYSKITVSQRIEPNSYYPHTIFGSQSYSHKEQMCEEVNGSYGSVSGANNADFAPAERVDTANVYVATTNNIVK